MSPGGDSPPSAPGLRGPFLYPPCLQLCCWSQEPSRWGQPSPQSPATASAGPPLPRAPAKLQAPIFGELPSPAGGGSSPRLRSGLAGAGSPGPRGGAGTWRCCRSCGPALASPPGQEGGGYPPAAPGIAIDRTRLPTPALPPITPPITPPLPRRSVPLQLGSRALLQTEPPSPFTTLSVSTIPRQESAFTPGPGAPSQLRLQRPTLAPQLPQTLIPTSTPRFLIRSTPGFPWHSGRCFHP